MTSYHKILGIQPGASKGQIKNAYRKLAKEYHPDINKSENAHDKFLEISEAYEVLYDGKIAKQKARNATQRTQSAKEKYWHVYKPPKDEQARAEWERVDAERRQYYKEKAERNAQKRYQAFKDDHDAFTKSFFYTPSLILYYLVQLLGVLFCLSMVILPFLGPTIDPEKYSSTPPVLLVLIFILPVAGGILYGFYAIKKVIDPYFYGY